jgi:hypothetical protein
MNSDDERGAQELKRRERLAASLRENLKRRKAQQRARAGATPPESQKRPPGPTEAGEG